MDIPLSDDEMAELGGQLATIAEISDAANNPARSSSESHSYEETLIPASQTSTTTPMGSPFSDDEMVGLGGQSATIDYAEILNVAENLVLYPSASHSYEETLIPSSFLSASVSVSQTMDSPFADDAELLYAIPALEEFTYEDWDMDENVLLADAEEDSLMSLDNFEFYFCPQSQPASQAAVDSLERYVFADCPTRPSKQIEHSCSDCSEHSCSICLESLLGRAVIKMPCAHTFHAPCIMTWLKEKHSCPYCRFSLPF